MVCKLDADIDYTVINHDIREQLEYVKEQIAKISLYQVVREPCQSLIDNGSCTYEEVPGLKEVNYDPNQEVFYQEEEKDAKASCFHFIIDQM